MPPVAERRAGLPGRTGTRSPEELRSDGTRKLDAARRQLENGRVEAAYQTATAAVALLHQAAKLDPESRPQLTEAISLCAECGRRLPARRQPDRNEATLYE